MNERVRFITTTKSEDCWAIKKVLKAIAKIRPRYLARSPVSIRSATQFMADAEPRFLVGERETMGLSTEGPGASRTVVRLLSAGIVSSLCQVMLPRPSAICAWLLFLVSSDYPFAPCLVVPVSPFRQGCSTTESGQPFFAAGRTPRSSPARGLQIPRRMYAQKLQQVPEA